MLIFLFYKADYVEALFLYFFYDAEDSKSWSREMNGKERTGMVLLGIVCGAIKVISQNFLGGPGTWKRISGNVAGFPFEIRTGSLPNKSFDRVLSTTVCSVACGAILSLFSYTHHWYAARLPKSSVFFTTIGTREDITSIYVINKIVFFSLRLTFFVPLDLQKICSFLKAHFKASQTNKTWTSEFYICLPVWWQYLQVLVYL
jgi:hypothetical protein